MPKRPCTQFLPAALLAALALCLGLLCACQPARPLTASDPASGPAARPTVQTPPSDRTRRLALAAFHLRDERGGGPLAALTVLDAPPGPEDGGAGAADGTGDEAGELALKALAFRQLGRSAEAVAVLDRLMLSRRDLQPAALADAFVERGLALAELGHQERAAEDFAAALGLAPRHVPALMARADQAFALERPAEAEAGYALVLAVEPENVLAHINRGVALDEQGRFAEAIAAFTRALALDPGSAAALANRGVSRSQTGDMAGMCADYVAACRLGACYRLSSAQSVGYCQDAQ